MSTNRKRKRAQRALVRQLEYQTRKSAKLRGHESEVVQSMIRTSAGVRAEIEKVRPIRSHARVIEVGSGAHGLIFFFGEEYRVGLDPLAWHYSKLFPHWQRKVPTVTAEGENLPFANDSFDVVLCDNVVDHAESPVNICRELVRILAPGGVLYFTVNIHHPIYSVASGLHGAWNAMGINLEIGPFADHTVHLTLNSARELFRDLPLRIISENSNIDEAKEKAQRKSARHVGDRLKRLFFKNALYQLIAVKESFASEIDS
jgi:SAM-dependent methyltransferase